MESNFRSLRRSRRNILAAGGLMAGAACSLLVTSRASAGHGGHGGRGGPACFFRGTRLLTPTGERTVEDLQVGELVTTLSGEAKPIQWIGRRVYRRSTGSGYPKSVLPVCIAAGSLGPDTPHRDLLISQEHALCVDSVLIKAADLINGSSITLRPDTELSEIEYLHVKLARHDVIFAEGAASETLIVHAGNDERFDNFAEYLQLYGENAAEEAPFAPIAFKNERERLLSRLRSAASPWFDRRNEFDKARDRIEELSALAA